MCIYGKVKTGQKRFRFFLKKITEIIDTDGRDIKVIVEEWGVSYEAVRLWMKGTRLPDGGQLLNLKRKLKCSIDSLLTGENKEFDESTAGQSEELKNLCLDLKEILETADEVSIAALKMNMAMIKGAVKDRNEKADQGLGKRSKGPKTAGTAWLCGGSRRLSPRCRKIANVIYVDFRSVAEVNQSRKSGGTGVVLFF